MPCMTLRKIFGLSLERARLQAAPQSRPLHNVVIPDRSIPFPKGLGCGVEGPAVSHHNVRCYPRPIRARSSILRASPKALRSKPHRRPPRRPHAGQGHHCLPRMSRGPHNPPTAPHQSRMDERSRQDGEMGSVSRSRRPRRSNRLSKRQLQPRQAPLRPATNLRFRKDIEVELSRHAVQAAGNRFSAPKGRHVKSPARKCWKK